MKKSFLCLLALLQSVIAIAATRQIAIETQSKGLYLTVENDGGLRQHHFGEKLSSPEDLLLDYKVTNQGSTLSQAYPTFGTQYHGEPALKVVHFDGNMTTRLIYQGHTTTLENNGEVQQTVVELKDEFYPFSVTLIYKAYLKEDVFSSSAIITNNEKGSVRLSGVMSSFLAFRADKYYLTRHYGSWASEMQMVQSQLLDGITVVDNKVGVRTTQDGAPSFILSLNSPASETTGEVVVGSLAWSGNYKLSFEVDNAKELKVLSGVNDFMSDYILESKESFATPQMIFTYSNSGVGTASRNLHRYVRRFNIQDGDLLRPIVLNSWEGAYFKFDEKVIKAMIDDAASMGVEMFVLDDGWFGQKHPRNNSTAGLGDWVINFNKLPNGLQALIDHAHKNKIKFGLWVEPEMVNPMSVLAEKHPDWIVTSPNREPLLERNQRLLDLTNPKVQEFVYNAVASLLKEHPGIEYIKWDANRNVTDFGSTYLSSDKQSHFWIEYTNGLYSVYEKLSKNFPNVIFQACASGAGRVDYGSLRYHHEVWGSDNTDAEWRIFINWGLSQYMPAIAVASHVSSSPNHQTKHISPIKFRFDVAMAQRLGVELQPKNLTPAELLWTKKGIAEYKRIRPVIQLGDQYRLISPYLGTSYSSTMYVSEDKSRAVLFAYSFNYHHRDNKFSVKMQGLDSSKKYKVNEIMALPRGKKGFFYTFPGQGKVFSGDYLMNKGVNLNIFRRYESSVLELIEVK